MYLFQQGKQFFYYLTIIIVRISFTWSSLVDKHSVYLRIFKDENAPPFLYYIIGVKPYKCEMCDKRFARDQQRRVHQVVHTGDKSHLCCECGQSFGSASTLIDHKKRKHLFMRDHQCQKCKKGFFTKQELEAHVRVHTGDKPYQCPVRKKTLHNVVFQRK